MFLKYRYYLYIFNITLFFIIYHQLKGATILFPYQLYGNFNHRVPGLILDLSVPVPIWVDSRSASKDNHVRRGVIKHCQTCTLPFSFYLSFSLSHKHMQLCVCSSLSGTFRQKEATKSIRTV